MVIPKQLASCKCHRGSLLYSLRLFLCKDVSVLLAVLYLPVNVHCGLVGNIPCLLRLGCIGYPLRILHNALTLVALGGGRTGRKRVLLLFRLCILNIL